MQNFTSFWYQKKCQREANIPGENKTKEYADKIKTYFDQFWFVDPNTLNLDPDPQVTLDQSLFMF